MENMLRLRVFLVKPLSGATVLYWAPPSPPTAKLNVFTSGTLMHSTDYSSTWSDGKKLMHNRVRVDSRTLGPAIQIIRPLPDVFVENERYLSFD